MQIFSVGSSKDSGEPISIKDSYGLKNNLAVWGGMGFLSEVTLKQNLG